MSLFIKEICQDQKVYLLTSDQGFAISYSEEFEYEDGTNLEVICFWSNTDLAEKAKRNQWANHKIDSIDLNTFLEEYDSADILCIDNILFLAHREVTQECFVQIIDKYIRNNKQVIITTTLELSIGFSEMLKSKIHQGIKFTI